MKRKEKRLLSICLAAILTVAQLPAAAAADNRIAGHRANIAAEGREDGLGHGSITSFAALPDRVANQEVAAGTELSGIELPDTVTAEVRRAVMEDDPIVDEDDIEEGDPGASTATPSEAVESGFTGGARAGKPSGERSTVTTTRSKIPVTWGCKPAYDGDRPDTYVFTPDVGDYALSNGVKLPQITVTVVADTAKNPTENPNGKPTGEPLPCALSEGCTLEEGHEGDCVTAPPANDGLEKTITGWTFVDDENLTGNELALTGVDADNQADFDTVVSMLPTQISATIEGAEGPEILDITWNCPEYKQDENGNQVNGAEGGGEDGLGHWPLTGEYTFTAELPEGYACGTLPTVNVLLGGVSVLTINDRYTVDGLVYHETGPKTVQLIGLAEPNFTGTVRVPARIASGGRTYAVTGIGDSAFQGSGITGLDLSKADNLTRIGYLSFKGCASLTGAVRIPAGVTEIGASAFWESGITSLDFSGADDLTRIGDTAFSSCVSLTGTVHIPAGVTEIGDGAFLGSGITGLHLSGADSLTRIGQSAFNSCPNLTGTVIVPARVTEIGNSAFLGSGITGLDLSGAAGLTRIGQRAFQRCTGLTETVRVPGGVTEIGVSAFHGSGITGLDLTGASSLTRIGADAFYECTNLTGTVFVPDTVTEIGSDAFLRAGNITGFTAASNEVAALLRDAGVDPGKITLSGGAPSLPQIVEFTEDNLNYRVTGVDTVSVIKTNTASGELVIPARVSHEGTDYRVTEIERYAFEPESSITSLNLSYAANLTRIGQSAFLNLSNLTGSVSIPAGVTEIGDYAFCRSGITGLNLSGATSLTRIGSDAFNGCSSLTETVVIPAGVTEIGDRAFVGSGIIGLDLGGAASLTRIGDSAFFDCSSLTGTVVIPAAVTEIDIGAFWGSGIIGLDLGGAASLTRIGDGAFFDCGSLTGTADIPSSITAIGARAFDGTGITEAVIRGRLQSIGAGAFPLNIPVHCSDPATQLLVNEVLRNADIPTASWDGQDDVPPGAIVTVESDVTINGNVAIGEEAEVTIGAGVTVVVESGAVITIGPGAVLTIDPGVALGGSGTIVVEPGGTLNGMPGSGITVIAAVTVVNGDVTNGDGTGKFPAGAQVGVTASPAPAGQVFDKWTSQDGISFDNGGKISTTFIMPAKAVTVTATYKNSGGGSSTGGSSYTNPDILRGVWIQTDTGIWMFRQTNGAYAKNCWGIVDGLWYYFDSEGRMLTGWRFDPVYQNWFYLDAGGAMVTGWREIEGKWYYFNPVSDGKKGIMLTDVWIDGWYVDKTGVWNGEPKKES